MLCGHTGSDYGPGEDRCGSHSRVSVSNEPIFRERVKKGPENPISVVADKAAARGANPAHDRSF
jgi:hypothetical protein